MSQEILRAIGRIEGRLDGIDGKLDDQGQTLHGIDARLRSVEGRTVRNGSIAGGAAAVGVALIVETIKKGTGL